jgi:hypothetical protein
LRKAFSEATVLERYLRIVVAGYPALSLEADLGWLYEARVVLGQLAERQAKRPGSLRPTLDDRHREFEQKSRAIRNLSPDRLDPSMRVVLRGALEALRASIALAGDSDYPPPPRNSALGPVRLRRVPSH